MPLNNARHDLIGQRLLTKTHGEHVTLYQVVPCSCRGASGEHADPTCKVCGGSGRAYAAGTRIKGLVAALSSQDKTLLQAGLAMPGDLTFSPEVGNRLSIHDYDMIRLDYGLPHEGDVVERGVDRLLYLPTSIASVDQHDPIVGTRTSYARGADYTVNGQTLAWVAGHGPQRGTAYSVKYDARFDWVVYPGVTLPRRARGTYLGQRVLLRKRHLAGITATIPG